ncbi:Asp23/Gls24 family envelope stress response protein [Actinosynnema sp. NPDC023587]|uniref:Asp23/Gls24 family envelope stress response protein n=1 Tax=Actinosynnema sp. NPDC023587 TaxID=3154695 RepID=UPI0033FC8030
MSSGGRRIRTYVVPLDAIFESDVEDVAGADADDRGSLDIHSSVLRKIAERAVGLAPAAEDGSSVKVHEDGHVLDIAVKLTLRYPTPVRRAADSVRRTVSDEVERITGYRVREVDVTVSALRAPTPPRVG